MDHRSSEPTPPAAEAPRAGRRLRRDGLGSVLALVGAALVTLGAFLPWVISGSAGRSSFATVRSADRLGVVPDGAALLLLRSWYLMPLAAAGIPVALLFHRRRLAAAVALALAAVTAVVAGLVILASPSTGTGPAISLVGGAILLLGALLLRGPRPTGGR